MISRRNSGAEEAEGFSLDLSLRKLINKYDCNFTFFIGGMFAIVLFCCVYGVRIINPSYDDWLFCGLNREDLFQHYLGWLMYRNSEWYFPITLIDNVYYPHLMPVVYTDSVPIFAVVFKILSPLLPERFQYFGLFGVFTYFFMGGFSALVLYKFTYSKVYSVIGSVFCSFSMLMLIRTFWHTALGAQWIVLASIYIMFHKEKEWSIKKSAAYWSLLIFLAMGIQAYFLPMVMITMFFSILAGVLDKKNRRYSWLKLVTCLFSGCLVVFISGWILGYFYGSVSNVGTGLGFFSYNYNSFINNMEYSYIFPSFPLFHWGQYEGYAYLGAGIYLCMIVATCLSFVKKNKNEDVVDGNLIKVLPFYCIILIIFAGSNIISWGDIGYEIPLPRFFTDIWAMFRSSGRMIWPVFYMFTLLILAALYKVVNKKRMAIVICVLCLALQLYENSYYALIVHRTYSVEHKYDSMLEDEEWIRIADNYDHFMICSDIEQIYTDYDAKNKSLELAYFANEHGMTVNTMFFARDVSSVVNNEIEQYFGSGVPEMNDTTVYVFLDGITNDDLNLEYHEYDGIVIGERR